MPSQERRPWTIFEDNLLREAVQNEDPGDHAPSRWQAIAKHVPHRTNRDCRKRWFTNMATEGYLKGPWSPEEDERLLDAIKLHGTRWFLVAPLVMTRNNDQCAKRWNDTLNPQISRAHWTPKEDAQLVNAVREHGRVWSKIVKFYFPDRSGLSAKNRYHSITRIRTPFSKGQDEIPLHRTEFAHSPLALPDSIQESDSPPSSRVSLEQGFLPAHTMPLTSVDEQGQSALIATAHSTRPHSAHFVDHPQLSAVCVPAIQNAEVAAFSPSLEVEGYYSYVTPHPHNRDHSTPQQIDQFNHVHRRTVAWSEPPIPAFILL